jgi:hypothetical protein
VNLEKFSLWKFGLRLYNIHILLRQSFKYFWVISFRQVTKAAQLTTFPMKSYAAIMKGDANEFSSVQLYTNWNSEGILGARKSLYCLGLITPMGSVFPVHSWLISRKKAESKNGRGVQSSYVSPDSSFRP